MSFVHLHVHSCYSLLDGAIRLEDLVDTALEMGMPAAALTDHGQMMGLWSFYHLAVKKGLKPILGVEAYVANHGRHERNPNESRHHLILLAQNLAGYQNLCRLISLANREGFYYKPRVDKELLAQYSQGIIALSGCLQGELAQEILRGSSLESAAAIARTYSAIFPDRFYLEIQENGLPQQTQVNEALYDLAQKTSLPLIATNDCHYLKKEHHQAHDILLCVQTRKKVTDSDRLKMESQEFYFKSPQEMTEAFAWCPEAISNTLAVAASCDVVFPAKTYHYPNYQSPDGSSSEEIIRLRSQEGLERRIQACADRGQPLSPEQIETYRQRLEYELSVIISMGFPGYFLIVSDFIQWARDHKIMVGPGRGSGAGSLAAWCLGIINVDPIRYGLLFERFLNPERKSMPDFDVDFCAEGRGEVIRYVTEKYGGSEYVAQILAVGQMKAKAVIRDVGRALGLDLQFVDPLAKLIPDNNTIGQALEAEPQLQELAKSNPQVQTLLEYGRLLENLPRHSSVHASGIVISDRPLMEYLPLMCDTKQPEQNGLRLQAVTQYEKKEIEANGLVKFDLLGLKNMTLIKHCLALLAKRGVNINLDDLDFKDEKTFDLLCSGKVNGVFQLDGPGIRRILVRLAPRSLEDISVLLALYRPGPIKGGKVDEYVEIHHGRQKAHIPLPQMVPILEETHGVIVYQEQAMMICRVLAGYSMGDADLIRRAMGEKKPEQMGEMKASFLEGCQKNRIPAEQAAQAFDAIANFAEYGFNKSHSLAYAVVTYQTAWLKTHYLPEFMAAFFTSEMDKPERIGRFLDDGRRSGLTIRPPSVNWSEYTFTVSEGDIIYGLGAVKGVGQGAAEAIAAERKEGGPYEDLFDLCRRVNSKKINSRTLEALIYAGAFDGLGDQPREVMAAALPEAMSQSRKGRNKKPEAGLFDFLAAPELPASGKWPKAELLTEMEILNLEKDCLGFFLSGHPLDRYEGAFRALSSTPLGRLRLKPDKTPVSLAGRISRVVHKIDRKDRAFVFATLADRTSSAELAVWSRMLKKCKEFLQEDRLVYLEGILQESRSERFGPNVEVTAMLSLEDSLTKVRSLFIRTLKADLPLLADFLLPHLKTKSGGDPVVWIGIQDSRGESFYRLDQSLKLSADLLDEARRSLGSLMEIRCLMTDGPAAVRS